jgi:hypothetical protein
LTALQIISGDVSKISNLTIGKFRKQGMVLGVDTSFGEGC